MNDLLEILKNFSAKQWAAIITLIVSCFTGVAWVENRYASKDSADMILDNLISLDSKLSAIIDTQFNKEEIEKIKHTAELYKVQMTRYREEKNEK